jgi:Flp pilus assembly protein TadG
MRRAQSGQALVEWAASAFVLLLFAFSFLAVDQIASEYMVVRSAATQAAFAAARAPSELDAQDSAKQAAREAVASSQVRDFQMTLDANRFQRGAVLTATATGCVGLDFFPFASDLFGRCVQVRWSAHALIEPFRSRTQ